MFSLNCLINTFRDPFLRCVIRTHIRFVLDLRKRIKLLNLHSIYWKSTRNISIGGNIKVFWMHSSKNCIFLVMYTSLKWEIFLLNNIIYQRIKWVLAVFYGYFEVWAVLVMSVNEVVLTTLNTISGISFNRGIYP